MKFSLIALLDEGMATCTFDADITWFPLDPATKPFRRKFPQRITEIDMIDLEGDGSWFYQVLPYNVDLAFEDPQQRLPSTNWFRRLLTPFAEWILEL